MTNFDAYFDKFSDSGKRVLKFAVDESQHQKKYVSAEHILYALSEAEKELFDSAMKELSFDQNAVRRSLKKSLENSYYHAGEGIRIAPEATKIFRLSLDRAHSQGRRVIEASDILDELITDENSLLNSILQNLSS